MRSEASRGDSLINRLGPNAEDKVNIFELQTKVIYRPSYQQ